MTSSTKLRTTRKALPALFILAMVILLVGMMVTPVIAGAEPFVEVYGAKRTEGWEGDLPDGLFRFAIIDEDGYILALTTNEGSSYSFDVDIADILPEDANPDLYMISPLFVVEVGLASDPAPALGSLFAGTSAPKAGWTFDDSRREFFIGLEWDDFEIDVATYFPGEQGMFFTNLYEEPAPETTVEMSVVKILIDEDLNEIKDSGKVFYVSIFDANNQLIERFPLVAGGPAHIVGGLVPGETYFIKEESAAGFEFGGFLLTDADGEFWVEEPEAVLEVSREQVDTIELIVVNVEIPTDGVPATGDMLSLIPLALSAVAGSTIISYVVSRKRR